MKDSNASCTDDFCIYLLPFYLFTFLPFHRRAFAKGGYHQTSVKELVDSEGQRLVNTCGVRCLL